MPVPTERMAWSADSSASWVGVGYPEGDMGRLAANVACTYPLHVHIEQSLTQRDCTNIFPMLCSMRMVANEHSNLNL